MYCPLISIIVPTYNYGDFIETAINSVLAQSYSNFELIILDNASTDNTKDIVAQYKDERIKYFCNSTNIGMVQNWNRGVNIASGEYLTILCADDYWSPEYLNAVLREIQNSEMVFTNSKIICNKGARVFDNPFKGKTYITAFDLINKFYGVPLSSLIIKLIGDRKKYLFNSDLSFNCDLELILRLIIKHKFRLKYLDEPLVWVRLHGDNETRNYDVLSENAKLLVVVSKYVEDFLLILYIKIKLLRLKYEKNICVHSML